MKPPTPFQEGLLLGIVAGAAAVHVVYFVIDWWLDDRPGKKPPITWCK